MRKCSKEKYKNAALWLRATPHILLAERNDGVAYEYQGKDLATMLYAIMRSDPKMAEIIVSAADRYVEEQERVASN